MPERMKESAHNSTTSIAKLSSHEESKLHDEVIEETCGFSVASMLSMLPDGPRRCACQELVGMQTANGILCGCRPKGLISNPAASIT